MKKKNGTRKAGHFFDKWFKRDLLFSTLFIFAVMGLLQFSVVHLEALNPIEKALSDFDYSDLVFKYNSQRKDEIEKSKIVIVDIGNSRKEIARQIETLNHFHPAVIAIDAWFEEPKNAEDDSLLVQVLKNSKHVVVGSYLLHKDSLNKTDLIKSFDAVSAAAPNGFVNFAAEYEKTIRFFHPFESIDGKQINSFAAEIVKEYDEEKYKALKARGNTLEYIWYATNADQFIPHFSVEEITDSNTALHEIENNIVLLGKTDNMDLEDLHFTPFNHELAGRSRPDMSGVFIHGNIIQMLLNKDYINKIPAWLILIISFLFTYVFLVFDTYIFVEKHMWYHLFAKVFQLVLLVALVFIKLILLRNFHLVFDEGVIVLPLVLSVDLLYFYDAIANWLHARFGFSTFYARNNRH